MSRQCRLPVSYRLKGFSLIELMVSLTIGLIIAIAAFSAYLGSSSASKMAEAQGRMNEDAQAALSILTQQIRMAQNNPRQAGRTDNTRINPIYSFSSKTASPASYPSSTSPPSPPSMYSIRGCDGTFKNTSTAAGVNNLRCDDDGLIGSVVINFEADIYNSGRSQSPASVPTDCLGNSLKKVDVTFTPPPPPNPPPPPVGPYPYYVAENWFYLVSSSPPAASNSPLGLYCQGNGVNSDGSMSTAKLMVENIEDMQFQYGVVGPSFLPADPSVPQVIGYLTAKKINNNINDSASSDAWGKVVSVQVCVLVRSEALVASNMASASYFKCDGTLNNTPPDLRLRRAYYATVTLRNRRP